MKSRQMPRACFLSMQNQIHCSFYCLAWVASFMACSGNFHSTNMSVNLFIDESIEFDRFPWIQTHTQTHTHTQAQTYKKWFPVYQSYEFFPDRFFFFFSSNNGESNHNKKAQKMEKKNLNRDCFDVAGSVLFFVWFRAQLSILLMLEATSCRLIPKRWSGNTCF